MRPSSEHATLFQPGLGVLFVAHVMPESKDVKYGSPVAKGIAKTLVPPTEQAMAPHSSDGIFSGAQVFPESAEEYTGSMPAVPAKHFVPSPDMASVIQLLDGALPGFQVCPPSVEE